MFGDYKEAIKVLERQQSLWRMRLQRCAWWELTERKRIGAAITALSMAMMALESAWNAEEEDFSRRYLQSGAIDVEDLPYDAVAVYKRELAAKGGKCDA